MSSARVAAKSLTLRLACAALATPGVHAQVALSGPVTGGERGGPFGGFGQAVPAGYVEEEYFLAGTATSYTRANAWERDGRWDVVSDEREPFTVRMLVRRPTDAAAFNGVVVVEWLNVTGRAEGAADYMQMAEELVRGGYAWVGVGAQAIGVHAPSTGLKAWDSVRYEPLEHPGDRFSYDVFSQAARAVRGASARSGPMGGSPWRI